MLRVSFVHIRPEKEERLREWLAELGRRKGEVTETFRQENTRHEQVFIVPGNAGPVLVYAMEAEDFAHAAAAYKESSLSIDSEHRAVMKECLLEPLRILPLFDCALNEGGHAA